MDDSKFLAGAIADTAPIQTPVPKTFNNYGSGIQIGTFTGTLNAEFSLEALNYMRMFFSGAPMAGGSNAIAWSLLKHGLYNLFVLENETYCNGVFSISKSCALKKYTDIPLQEKYRSLSRESIEELKAIPSIFAMRNKAFKTTTPEHVAYVGQITDIYVQGNAVKFCFHGFRPIYQESLNKNADLLALNSCSGRNELDEEHWSIKVCNLAEQFVKMGIMIQ